MACQVDEIDLLLTKIWALANMLNQAAGAGYDFVNSRTVIKVTSDKVETIEKIQAKIKI